MRPDVALTELHFEDRHFAARNFRQHHVVRDNSTSCRMMKLEEFLHVDSAVRRREEAFVSAGAAAGSIAAGAESCHWFCFNRHRRWLRLWRGGRLFLLPQLLLFSPQLPVLSFLDQTAHRVRRLRTFADPMLDPVQFEGAVCPACLRIVRCPTIS